MAAPKFLRNILGVITEVFASTTSAPDVIVATGADGKLDISLMPTGVGAETVVCVAKETLVAGNFVNLTLDAGVIKAQKADATNNAKPANGFVLAASANPGDPATVFLLSNKNTQVSGLVIGTKYYLSTVPGGVTDTPPAANGNIVQYIGKATETTQLPFVNETYIEVVA